MFILLIGLLGVGALIPAGKSEIMASVKTDYGTTVGRAALRDLQVRSYLNPTKWALGVGTVYSADRTPTSTPPGPFLPVIGGPYKPCVMIDPLGCTAGTISSFADTFPFNPGVLPSGLPAPSLKRLNIVQTESPFTTMSKQVADTVFRCGDDLLTKPNGDLPPIQQSVPFSGPMLARASNGNYSWMASVVTDPNVSAMGSPVTVSVVTLYKRDLTDANASESVAEVTFPSPTLWVDEVVLQAPALRAVRPGQWFMLGGRIMVRDLDNPSGPLIEATVARWYRVVGAGLIYNDKQDVTVAGLPWPMTAFNVRAWIVEGVIAVSERNMSLEL